MHFVDLCYTIIVQYTVQKNIKNRKLNCQVVLASRVCVPLFCDMAVSEDGLLFTVCLLFLGLLLETWCRSTMCVTFFEA